MSFQRATSFCINGKCIATLETANAKVYQTNESVLRQWSTCNAWVVTPPHCSYWLKFPSVYVEAVRFKLDFWGIFNSNTFYRFFTSFIFFWDTKIFWNHQLSVSTINLISLNFFNILSWKKDLNSNYSE